MKTVYISGPISNMVDKNRSNFELASIILIKKGYIAVNPLEIVSDDGASWDECMKLDIAEMLRCDAVMALSGWQKSTGATLEIMIARKLGIPVFDIHFQEVDVSDLIDYDLLRPEPYKI
jgi:nucleoside 2-deoxyribosyltransferase